MKRTPMLVQCLGAIALMGAGCADMDTIRAVTYPPDFHYITQREIHTTMGALAVEVDALDEIMWRADGGPRPEDRTRVVEILTRMQSLSKGLKRREHSNHPLIHLRAPALQQEIGRALEYARHDPPSFYYAAQVSGACSYCHAPRQGRAPARQGPRPVPPPRGDLVP